ncbi:MAG TPA: hypothetical protein VHH35_00990, partial [Pyrinomonadaceae bacterium]|nr:hypothetical protein [Pyrinomonadaceae bacterium]
IVRVKKYHNALAPAKSIRRRVFLPKPTFKIARWKNKRFIFSRFLRRGGKGMHPHLFPWVRLGWLLALLRGRIPYPVLVLNGERREFGEITVRVIREGTGCRVRTRTTARIITNRNDHRQGTRPFYGYQPR